MKKILFLIALSAALFSSCKKTTSISVTEAIVTVKGTSDCTLQLDDQTVLVPQNISGNPFGRNIRAHIYYNDLGATEPNGQSSSYRKVKVLQLDTIITKKTVPNLGPNENDKVYGTAPVGFYDSWMTVVEDGYVTLHFTGLWGYSGISHTVNLVSLGYPDAGSPANTLAFEFRHNYNGDSPSVSGRLVSKVVAFDISSELASIVGASDYYIVIKYTFLNGVSRTLKFHYEPGTSANLSEGGDDDNSLAEATGLN